MSGIIKIWIAFVLIILSTQVHAQRISFADSKVLHKREDSLKALSLRIIQGRTASDRFTADSLFTKIFVRALKVKGSFTYKFDSLFTISKLVPYDSSFRIFTWQMVINDNVVRQHGAIQMRTPDGSLKLFPLIDKSALTEHTIDTVANNFGWIGAVYYRIIQKQAFGKSYYTLLGYDENNIRTNRKMIEVLSFNNGEPIFGGPFFSFPDGSIKKKFIARYILEFKKNASPRLTYDADQDMIIYEHLISETGEMGKKYTYIPDGDYEGLKWKDGKWVHIEKVYTYKLQDGQEPVPHPIRDAKGTIDETLLKDNSAPENGNEYDSNPTQKEKTKSKSTTGKDKTKSQIIR